MLITCRGHRRLSLGVNDSCWLPTSHGVADVSECNRTPKHAGLKLKGGHKRDDMR